MNGDRTLWLEHLVYVAAPGGRPEQAADFRFLAERHPYRPPRPLTTTDVRRLTQPFARAGPLPSWIIRSYDRRTNRAIARLVLDGILAVETRVGFVTGADACSSVLAPDPPPAGSSRTVQLAIDALAYGSRLTHLDQRALAERLYRFNTLPASVRWHRRLVNPIETPLAPSFGWSRREADGAAVWDHWDPSSNESTGSHRRNQGLTFKLYVSPSGDEIRRTVRRVMALAARSSAISAKIGRPPYGLLRPDKIVLYFSGKRDLIETQAALAGALEGVRAQAVPFTCALRADGLLSWGVDSSRAGGPSWREWITLRLAGALGVWARAARPALEAWRFALARLRLDGVESGTFAPTEAYLSALSHGATPH